MKMIRKFDVELMCNASYHQMCWPAPDEYPYQMINHHHVDYEGITWQEAFDALDFEESIIVKLRDHDIDEIEELADENYEHRHEYLIGLNLGVSGTVQALYAAGCVPYTSCNGGCFGDYHEERYPLVVFFADPVRIDPLLNMARHADVGLINNIGGSLCLYAGDIERIVAFGRELAARRHDFI